jgi:pimeloyl-ACP methyl ester carboxylesterase
MQKVTSKDGTPMAYDRQGAGPAVILVDGAMTSRSSDNKSELMHLLAPHFTVYSYDRRGRGDSGDTQPYAVEREVEDIEVLIREVGAPAYLYGHSSGASLAMDAAVQLGNTMVKKLAMYEAPYDSNQDDQQAWKDYLQELTESLAAGRRGDAVAAFMKFVGTPAEQIAGMRQAPFWPGLEAIAPTLAYDHVAILGEDRSVPVAKAARVSVPALVMNGSASFPFMETTARALEKAIPHAQYRALEGQTHNVDPEALAPALIAFFGA